MSKSFRFIDLFAGIGGLRIPFDDHGECVFTSELNPAARAVYSDNFGVDVNDIDTDITKATDPLSDKFPDHDLVLAGFPCQPFSHAGLKKGFEDLRGTLFFSIAAVAAAKRPKVLLLENVRGLKSHDGGYTFQKIQDTLAELGYVAHHAILNARDFGLPQNRNRLFIVCIRADIENASSYSFPMPTHQRANLRVGDFLDANVDERYTLSDRLWAGHQRRKEQNVRDGKGFGYQLFNSDSEYIATISARYFKDGSEALIEQPGGNPRKITPNEARRFQGFPESFKLAKSNTEAYRQFGNAVPVNVIQSIATTLLPYLR